jgi:hypothetical protein
MAMERQGMPGLNYTEFRSRLAIEEFTLGQMGPMKLRLDLLESFLRTTANVQRGIQKVHVQNNRKKGQTIEFKPLKQLGFGEESELKKAWTFSPGSLTIVDLSCPFVDESAACALFTICLEIFLENRNNVGRVIALDEAHKVRYVTPDRFSAFRNTYSHKVSNWYHRCH